jgi:hypothetical protein
MTNVFAPLQGTTKPEHIASVANYQPLTLRAYLSEDNPTEEELLWLVRTLYTLGKPSDSVIRAFTKYEKVRKERELRELGVLEAWQSRKKS